MPFLPTSTQIINWLSKNHGKLSRTLGLIKEAPMSPEHDDHYWREKLSPEQYQVCRQKGTEAPFTGKYTDCTADGIYHCVCCGQALFDSANKYHSGCGWPSFWLPLNETSLDQHTDLSHGMRRVEVTCQSCGAHLGHVFPDGPEPTGLRYCINSVAIDLQEKS